MSAPLDGRRRSVRAGVFVLIAAQIAVAGHVVGGGTPPALPLLAIMSALLLVVLRSVATRRLRFPTLLAAMSGTQVVFHLVLTMAGSHHAATHENPLPMVAFHALAALIAAGLLAHGEKLLFALHHRLIRRRLFAVVTGPVAPSAGWTAVVDRAGHALRSRLTGTTVSRRGPPAAELAPSC